MDDLSRAVFPAFFLPPFSVCPASGEERIGFFKETDPILTMHRTPVFVTGLVLLLAACLISAGCSAPGTGNQTAQPTQPSARYAAGDIVKNPSSSADTAWLVIGYDPASDTYERALIYPKAGGDWGYRKDNRTEKATRAVMEKVYTEVLGNIAPSSVPIVTPTVPATVITTRTAASATTVTTSDTASLRPVVERSIPDSGYAGTTVTITDLVGKNFLAGATVLLSKENESDIVATNVNVVSQRSITCSFDLPSDAEVGTWNLTVRNPNGLSGTYANYFTVNRDTSVVMETVAAKTGTIVIQYVDPPGAVSHTYREYIITTSGSKLLPGATVTLRSQSGRADIAGTDVRVDSDTQLRCFFDIPVNSFGVWDIIIRNSDGKSGTWVGGFLVSG
jgi:hypothetical protein